MAVELKELSVSEVASTLGIAESLLIDLIEKRGLPHHRSSGRIAISHDDLPQYEHARDQARREMLNAMLRESVEDGSYDYPYQFDLDK